MIDKEETLHWLSQRDLIDSSGDFSFSGLVQVMDFAIPADSGRKTALSRVLVSLFDVDDEALLWINEFGIWESSEDQYLFHGFRYFLGERSSLYDKPAHLFSKSDLNAIRSLVAMVLYFVWGAILHSPAKGLAIRITHDEFITVYVREAANCGAITDTLKQFL